MKKRLERFLTELLYSFLFALFIVIFVFVMTILTQPLFGGS